ncbi:MAG TPA: arylsulfotransferase family protein [Gaiellaceae bacterium]|nr:arylsulfotransferase family protein [Gaiellaceae bacterium]
MRRAPLLLLAALAVLPATPAAARPHARPPALVRLTSTPALYPAYDPAIHDYVVRCTAGTQVRFTAWAAAGTAPSIAGRRGRTAAVPLKPGAAVTIAGRSAAGETDYHVRCLPEDFPQWTETRTAATKSWYVLTPSLSLGQARSHYVAIFDGHGVPIWWYRTRRVPIDAKLLPGRTPLVAFASFPASTPEYQIRRLDGTFVRKVVSPDGRIDDHELQRVGNGDFVYLVYQPRRHLDLTPYGGPADATVLEAHVEEVSPAGKLVWSWQSDDSVSLDESVRWLPTIIPAPVFIPGPDNAPEPSYDFFHPNAVSVTRSTVYVSLRHTDAVYAIDRASGAILWKLGGTPTPASLTVVGDPYGDEPFGGQHDVRALADGTISVFDDGTFLGRPPRVARYRIDTVARTATLVQQVVDPAVTNSNCCGSARLMASGDWLVSWGGDPVVGEYRPDGTPVFTLTFADDIFSYRAVPVAPGRLTAAELRAAMDTLTKR